MNTSETIDRNVQDFLYALAPYGELDLRTAINVAVEVDENGAWVAEQVEETSENCEIPIKNIDVVACVYDTILQEARNEIDNLIDFDFVNDDAEIYTAGNYMATSYDGTDEAKELIKSKLIENNITFEDLSVKTQWFLEAIDISF